MKVLIVGGGGREDALTWALSRSERVKEIYCAPGNAGSDRYATRVPIVADDVDRLVEHAREMRYDLVVIGPEDPLVAGLADRLRELGIPTFGPSAAAAELEGSKVFSKEFMRRHDIPTADFQVFDDLQNAVEYLRSGRARYPLVVKADGLAAGKGVILADDEATAIEAAKSMLEDGLFGAAGARILVEDRLYGREVSYFVLSDGKNILPLTTCQDYKRAHDADEGPNTGGMGTYSPSAFLDETMEKTILKTVVAPTIEGLASEGRPYQGVLFLGLMLTVDGPLVLEYNVRFGDPETQVLMPRLHGDWAELLTACADGTLGDREPRWRDEAAVCAVMASAGSPGSYEKGLEICGLEAASERENTVVFHAGTALDTEGRVRTAGGRVLGVTAWGGDLTEARERAYQGVATIDWPQAQWRTDIAADALRTVRETQS
jgi:phosphoribosylamine--glycine ligase